MRISRSRRPTVMWDVQAGDVFVFGEGSDAVRLLVHSHQPVDDYYDYPRVFGQVVDERAAPTTIDLSDPEGRDSSIPVGRPAQPVTAWDDVSDVLDVIADGGGVEELLTPGLVVVVPERSRSVDVHEPRRAGFVLERRGEDPPDLHGHAVLLRWAELGRRLAGASASS